MNGNVIIVILLVPILFQLGMLAYKQTRRHREIQSRLDEIDRKLAS